MTGHPESVAINEDEMFARLAMLRRQYTGTDPLALFAPVLEEEGDCGSSHSCVTVEHWAFVDGEFCRTEPRKEIRL